MDYAALGGGGVMTLDTYSHVAPGLQEAAAVRFDDVLVSQNQSKPVQSTGG